MYEYKKRGGTSGISGQLYESKLISLILFRLQHDDSVKEFYLASNMDDIGAFDDICFKVKIKEYERPIYVFIQSKHKEQGAKYLSYDLIKHFYISYTKVKQNFYSNKKNVFFNNEFDNTDCVFILYTNAKYSNEISNDLEGIYKTRKPYESGFADKLNSLIATGDGGSHPDYTEEDLEFANKIILEEEITTLAENFVKFLIGKSNQSMNMMLDKYILRYHVVLASNVVEISEINSSEGKSGQQWRNLTFRQSFLCPNLNDKTLLMLRRKIYELVVKSKINNKKKNTKIVNESTDESLNPENFDEVAATFLQLLKIKVPTTFGNLDMAISGTREKVEKRMKTLVGFIEKLLKKSQLVGEYEIVTIDKNDGEGFLNLNNGIGSAVGNLLVYDNITKLLKFTQDPISLQNNARMLFEELGLNDEHNKLHMTRFDAKAVMFPKLIFNYADEAKLIFNQVVVYDKQSTQNGVEKKLKEAIEKHQNTYEPQSLTIKTDTLIIFYHNEIQKWWMSEGMVGTYFTKSSDEYQKAINIIVAEPQLSAIFTTFNMNTKRYFGYNFNETATETLKSLGVYPKTIVVTDLSTLTTIKVIQCLRKNKNNDYTVLDLEYILDLPSKDLDALYEELKNTTKLLIIICDSQNKSLYDKINLLANNIATLIQDKQIVVVTNNVLVKTVQEYFLRTYNILNDEKQSISDLTPELQRDIIKSAQVIFQGQKVNLDFILDRVSEAFIKGAVLNKIVRNETIMIGKPLTTSNYEQIKHLYVDRRVRPALDNDGDVYCENTEAKHKSFFVRKFADINKDFVLITATPGMGKSTLLTHLSLKTKEIDTKLWIVRVNLLDFSKVFHCWKIDKTNIDTIETLKFLCKVILSNNNILIDLKETNNKVYLDDCTGGELTIFQLNLFLHYYNEKDILFLFDGFDEICPNYKDKVFEFINIVKKSRHKMWVTSRPYSEILIDLEKVLGKAYELEYINDMEQDIYLNKCWQDKFIIEHLNDIQLNNVISFIDFMTKKNDPKFGRIAYLFYDHVNWYFPRIITQPKYSKYRRVVIRPNLTDILSDRESQPVDIIMGTPLLLYLYADYFLSQICTEETTEHNKLDEELSTLTIYETFVEVKLKKILFEEKNKMVVYNPDIIKIYEKERADCITMHKKIAAYALIFREISLEEFRETGPFNNEGLIEYGTIVHEIKNGIEKSGFISHVTNDNIPVFIYRTLEEYFAAEFACDIFKKNDFGFGKKNILYTLVTMKFDILAWINKKRKVDDELNSILTYLEIKRPPVVHTYGFLFGNGWPLEHIIRIRSSVAEDYATDCFEIYNYDFIKILRRLPSEDVNKSILEFQKNVIGKMKPHLKKYFTHILETFLVSEQEREEI